MKHTYLALTIIGLILGLNITGDLTKNDKHELLSPQPETIAEVVYATDPVAQPVEMVDPATAKIQKFLDGYGSPANFNAVSLVGGARRHGLRPDLLVIIGCVESSCGKFYNHNPFGWDSDSRFADYGTVEQSAEHIASRIARMVHYREWVESGQSDLVRFAKLYNYPHWQDYAQKLKWFEERMGEQ
mgnify:CR=1 FL=1